MIHGVSSLNRIYTLNAGTGQASFVSALDTPVVNAALCYGSDFNAPTITSVGSLGISGNVIGGNGFDIDAGGTGWAVLTLDNGDSGLYRIDLATGLATFDGALNANLRGFTSAPFMVAVPEPEIWGVLLAGVGLIGMIARRRPGQG